MQFTINQIQSPLQRVDDLFIIYFKRDIVSEFKLKSTFSTFCLFSAPSKCSLSSFYKQNQTVISGWLQLLTSLVQSSIDKNVIFALFLLAQTAIFFIVPYSSKAICSISFVKEKPLSHSTSKDDTSSQYFWVPIPSQIQFFMFSRYSSSLIFFSKNYFLLFSYFSISLCLCSYSCSLLFKSSAILLLSLSILASLFFLSSIAFMWFLYTNRLAQLSKNSKAWLILRNIYLADYYLFLSGWYLKARVRQFLRSCEKSASGAVSSTSYGSAPRLAINYLSISIYKSYCYYQIEDKICQYKFMNKTPIKMHQNKLVRRHTTEHRENDTSLPQISLPKRLVSLTNEVPVVERKFTSQKKRANYNVGKNEMKTFRKMIDENYHSVPIKGKGSLKYTKKKFQTNNYIIVQAIKKNANKDKLNLPSIESFQSDTYQGGRQYNEDRISINVQININSQIYSFFAVYDGHGGSGVAQYLKVSLVKSFERELAKNNRNVGEVLKKILREAEGSIMESSESKFIGGSCVCILVIHNFTYYIANIGDSRIVKAKLGKNRNVEVEQLTTDHKPENPIERKRIQKEGGKVYQSVSKIHNHKEEIRGPFRVFPGRLSVSRTIGDIKIKKQNYGWVISSQPQLREGNLEGNELFLIMSDGAYEKLTNQEIVCYFMKKNEEVPNLKRGMQSVLIQSMIRDSSDNISIISLLTKEKSN